MPKFEIVLKNEKAKTYTVISWLIIALNFISFLYMGISGSAEEINHPFFAAGIVLCIFLFQLIVKRKDESEINKFSLSFSVIVIAWIIMQFYWIAALNFFLFIFQDVSRRRLIVLFFDDRIIYPSFPKRTIQWQELNQVILKDGLLTIDLKNDKVFQNEIISDINAAELNEFCNSHILALRKN
jgi:heme/copper-type cytochrome/quinol oxidase subunit 4